MSDERSRQAIARIERALARIEQAAAQPRTDSSRNDALREAHRALRQKVQGTISEIDRLLADEKG